jgi:hypothetical protein
VSTKSGEDQSVINDVLSSDLMIEVTCWARGWGQRMYELKSVAPPGNQSADGENKRQLKYREKPVYSTQTKSNQWKEVL